MLRCALTSSVTFFRRLYFPHNLSPVMARRRKASRPLSTTNPNPRGFVNLENDLYREASNLSAATGANIAVICRRPSGEVRLWGYPSAQDVINRYHRNFRRQISEDSPPVPAVAQAAEARARHYADIRRREEELNGSLPSAAEQIVREHEWMIESLSREIEGVRKLIAEVIAKSGESQSLVEGSNAERGV
ncbi:hypothetical protein MA16_Dca020182 [Dendrobium catenatum]|uniref:MADS-box domain-containing protein n=1 Tax=Dendrobium catenatum TaxID=906689 RepID=A0A2I0WH66_9ASPA|nr:hypothetical protein MA16_Dca020182 [Dendrobium catenatum]